MSDREDSLDALADPRPLFALEKVDEVGYKDHVADLARAVEKSGHVCEVRPS